jgi:tetratricopeptide (TPR) repeat protein
MDSSERIELKTLRSKAEKYLNKGDFDRAIDIHTGIISRYRNNDRVCEKAYAGLGDIHLLLRELDLAENYFRLAISLNPLKLRYHYALGLSYAANRNWDLSLTEFKFCFDKCPEKHEYLWILAATYWCSGNIKEGLDHLRRALSPSPAGTLAMIDIAVDLLYMPDMDEVIAYAWNATRIAPGNPQARELLREVRKLQKTCCPMNRN